MVLANTGDVREVGSMPGSISPEPAPAPLPGESHGQRSLAGCTVTGVVKSRTRLERCCTYTGYILEHLTGNGYSVNVKFRRILKNFPFGCAVGACGILVPLPGIEPSPSVLEVWSLNHWTIKESPRRIFKDVFAGRCILGRPWWLSW